MSPTSSTEAVKGCVVRSLTDMDLSMPFSHKKETSTIFTVNVSFVLEARPLSSAARRSVAKSLVNDINWHSSH